MGKGFLMKKSVFYILLVLPIVVFSQGEIFRYAQELARQQKVTAPSLLPPPLDSNGNTELITGNAAAFPNNEVDGISGITAVGPAEVQVTSEEIDDGYEGDYVARVFANTYTGGYGRAEHQSVSVSSSTTYEYVLLYRHSGTGTSGRFRVYDGSSNIVDTNGLSQTDFTELSGTFTTGGSVTSVDFEIWCSRPFLSSDGTEWIEYKLTVKEQ